MKLVCLNEAGFGVGGVLAAKLRLTLYRDG